MAVQLPNAFLTVHSRKVRTNPLRHRRKLRLTRRDMVHSGQNLARAVPRDELFDDLADPDKRDRIPRRPRRQRLRHTLPSAPIRLLFAYANTPVRTAQRSFANKKE